MGLRADTKEKLLIGTLTGLLLASVLLVGLVVLLSPFALVAGLIHYGTPDWAAIGIAFVVVCVITGIIGEFVDYSL